MSDYRDPNDPMYGYEPADGTGIWGWIAGAAGLVIILVVGLALGVGHGPTTPRPRRRQHRGRTLQCPA